MPRNCIVCGTDISSRHPNAVRCEKHQKEHVRQRRTIYQKNYRSTEHGKTVRRRHSQSARRKRTTFAYSKTIKGKRAKKRSMKNYVLPKTGSLIERRAAKINAAGKLVLTPEGRAAFLYRKGFSKKQIGLELNIHSGQLHYWLKRQSVKNRSQHKKPK